MAGLFQWGKLSKCSKTLYYKSSFVTYFVQTCSLIPIHNGMYEPFYKSEEIWANYLQKLTQLIWIFLFLISTLNN